MENEQSDIKAIVKKRQSLRRTILIELYKWHFNKNGKVANNTVKNIEEKLAYQFLGDSGLAQVKEKGDLELVVKITTAGISYAEDLLLSE